MKALCAVFDPIFMYVYITPLLLIYLNWAGYTDWKYMKVRNITNLIFLVLRLVVVFYYPIGFTHLLGGLFGYLLIMIPRLMIECIPELVQKLPASAMAALPKNFVGEAYKTHEAGYSAGGDMKLCGVAGLWFGFVPSLFFLLISFLILIVKQLLRKAGKNQVSSYAQYLAISFDLMAVIYYVFVFANGYQSHLVTAIGGSVWAGWSIL